MGSSSNSSTGTAPSRPTRPPRRPAEGSVQPFPARRRLCCRRCHVDRFEGFAEFVLARGHALSRMAYLLTGDHQLAEDLLQQALTRTAAHWRRVIAGGNPEGYVRRVMLNERTSWWRRRRFT